MNIHQLSISFQLDHDRILVQINTQAGEILRVWLTRRLVINLFPRLHQLATNVEASKVQLANSNDDAKQMLMEFKKQESIAQGDYKTPFNTEAKAFPLGPEPLLVTAIQLIPAANGTLQIRFEEKLNETSRGFQVSMDSPLLHSFLHLLEASMQASEWGILPPRPAAAADEAAADTRQPTKPPRYLN